ncbi:MAG: phosphocholine cytidylyltransferase family protein [Nanoarchaeota archaeon]|nr:phosphocholine cytidylyltransferase family protein [DPANN group archaeon]MBL7116663.1 phosphocholine cytidylyltransferase family protein [Nanoarchaeota archaeon]
MKGIVIAAGICSRLRPITNNLPKCMLKIGDKSIMENILQVFENNDVDDIAIVRGYAKEKINFPDITYYENTAYTDNNILHSLMFARKHLEKAEKENEDIVISYSDILYEDWVIKKLINSKKTIAAIVDTDWQEYYEGRTDHPIEEAENVITDTNNKMLKIGKHIFTNNTPKNKQGEFIGLWKFTPEGIRIFLKHFDRLNSILKMIDTYQNTNEWQKSYITDIFQEMIDKGEEIHSVLIQKGWKEFDTVQDFKKIGGEIPSDIGGVDE